MKALLTLLLIWAVSGPAAALCSDTEVDLRGDWGQARFTVELADDAQERAQGLMFRDQMAMGHGMLFLYPQAHHARFWMRNTYIPLDMIFVDPSGRVTHVHENARPLDETVIDGGPGVVAVLEINGGLARRFGIGVGTELRHPSFGPDALWPCPAP